MLAEKGTNGSFQNLPNFEKFWTKLTIFMRNIQIKSSLFIGRAGKIGLRLYSGKIVLFLGIKSESSQYGINFNLVLMVSIELDILFAYFFSSIWDLP